MRNKIVIWIFLVPLFAVAIAYYFVPIDEQAIVEAENRAVQQLPKLQNDTFFSGTFGDQFETFFSDHFPMRMTWVDFGKSFVELYKWAIPGLPDAKIVTLKGGDNTAEGAGGKKNEEATRNSTYIISNRAAYPAFPANLENARKYQAVLNRAATRTPPDVKIFSALIPTHCEMLQSKLFDKYCNSQKDVFSLVEKGLDKRLQTVDVLKALEANKDDYIYFRTDHHWTGLGAYYAYRAIIEKTGQAPLSLEQFKQTQLKPFLGSLYRQLLDPSLAEQPDMLTTYEPPNRYQVQVFNRRDGKMYPWRLIDTRNDRHDYTVFFGGDQSLVVITSDNNNGKRLLLLRDSYANALIPFLVPHYEQIVVVDSRVLERDMPELMADYKINELMFLMSASITYSEKLSTKLDKVFSGKYKRAE